MQHGSGRELVQDLVENVAAVLEREVTRGKPYRDLVKALRIARDALEYPRLDERGVFGKDYDHDAHVHGFEPTRQGGLDSSPFYRSNPLGRQ